MFQREFTPGSVGFVKGDTGQEILWYNLQKEIEEIYTRIMQAYESSQGREPVVTNLLVKFKNTDYEFFVKLKERVLCHDLKSILDAASRKHQTLIIFNIAAMPEGTQTGFDPTVLEKFFTANGDF